MYRQRAGKKKVLDIPITFSQPHSRGGGDRPPRGGGFRGGRGEGRGRFGSGEFRGGRGGGDFRGGPRGRGGRGRGRGEGVSLVSRRYTSNKQQLFLLMKLTFIEKWKFTVLFGGFMCSAYYSIMQISNLCIPLYGNLFIR